ncbi:hypothetical protein Trydic_g21084 [Trypoxylus dichotomus]
MVLEKTVEAIMDAGYHPSDFENTRTGVFCASAVYHAYTTSLKESSDAITGAHYSMIAKRISYYLKLKGPAYAVDATCSGSLFALESAYLAIKEGKCDRAFVCGLHLCLKSGITLQFARLGVLSRDGRCKPFDDSADGFARSEGVVTILLERAKHAKRIYAEVVHVKTNSDGFKNEGMMCPSSEGHINLLRSFYGECEVDPSTLTFLEAHGTGTVVGDIIELNTIDTVFCTNRNRPLYIGSIKSNIGHNEGASGLSSIIKAIVAFESGYLPPNINYKNPRKNVEGLKKGRILVPTEKIILPDQNGLIGVINLGIGCTNAHALLRWNTKAKVNNPKPLDNLPRLLCVSGRTRESIDLILDDFRKRKCDTEYAYLIHQAFRKLYGEHLFRGFGISTMQSELKRSTKRLQQEKKPLCLIFTNFVSVDDWLKLAKELMKIKIFSKSINSVQNILLSLTNINLMNIVEKSKDISPMERQLLSIAIQIGLAEIIKEIQLIPNQILGEGYGKLVAAYMNNYLTLEELIVESCYLVIEKNKICDNNLVELRKALSKRRSSFNKWRCNNKRETSKNLIPAEAINVIIGEEKKCSLDNTINLVHDDNGDYILGILVSLGRLYQYGFSMELDKLYSPVELPVSRGTPMLSPLMKWHHTKDFEVYPIGNEDKVVANRRIINIIPKSEEWNYIKDHIIDGRNVFPGTGYLVIVWETFAKILDKSLPEMKIVFEDVKFFRPAYVPQEGVLELILTIQHKTNTFEITEGSTILVSGRIYEAEIEDDLIGTSAIVDEDCMNGKDIYKELSLRGYQYRGAFQNIKKSNIECTQTIIEWTGNWVIYLDNILQAQLLPLKSRDIQLQTTIQRLVIDAPEHFKAIAIFDNMVPVSFDIEKSVLRASGIEFRGLGITFTNKKKQGKPVLEVFKFIPNTTQIDISDSIRSFVQLILENVNTTKITVVEDCLQSQNKNELLTPQIIEILKDIPLIQQEITIIAKHSMDLEGITIQKQGLNKKNNCLLLVVSNLLETLKVSLALDTIKEANGFIISRENSDTNLFKFSNTPFEIICVHKNENETLVLLRAKQKDTPKRFIEIPSALNDFRWISKLQLLLKEENKIVLYARNENPNGILGLFNCLKKEYSAEKIGLMFLMDNAPTFDSELEFYKEQLDKNLVINVWKDKSWGTYRHLLLPERELVESEHCYVDVTTKGDLSTTSWIEGRFNGDNLKSVEEEDIVHIYYTPLNFKDFVIATGVLLPDNIIQEDINNDYGLGFEFVGRTSKGKRVMGMCSHGALATLKYDNRQFSIPIPDEWSMEDAGTIMAAYTTVVEALINRSHVKPGESILIHSACGGVGLAAIYLSLHFKLNVFVTVAEHIGNSRNTSFEEMIHQYTNEKGVNYVLNSLPEEKLFASVRCLATGGKFIEIGRLDAVANTALSLHLLEKQGQFIGVSLDKMFYGNRATQAVRKEQILNLIKDGAIKPLPRTVFQAEDIEKALRYLGRGQHIGKILIQMREEENDKLSSVPRSSFKGIPRFYCKPECSYILCGGLGGFGLEFAHLLIARGARNLILTSRSGVSNGYQKYRIRIWQNYGVRIIISTNTGSTEQECIDLLDTAIKLGPVDGIFNLAADFRDATFENQNLEDFEKTFLPKAFITQHLDKISRILCPQLRYFVAFSSYAAARGNAGQASYAMANSVMERICEKRKQEGYPSLAIQWGAIGDVGMVVKMQKDSKELIISGLLQQRISSCLDLMDKFLKQDQTVVGSMLVAEKKCSDKGNNLFDTVLKMMGITDLRTINLQLTLTELGADSITVVEIKQTLEQEYEVFLTLKEIRGLALFKLKELSKTSESGITCTSVEQNDVLDYITMLLHDACIEESISEPVFRLQSFTNENGDVPDVFILPGVEGASTTIKQLSKKIKANVSCLGYPSNIKIGSIQELAESLLPHIKDAIGNLVILAYSYGGIVATELVHLLESMGRMVKIIFVDGSPDLILEITNSVDDENSFQTMLLCFLISKYIDYDDIIIHKEAILDLKDYESKIDYIVKLLPKLELFKEHIRKMHYSTFHRLKIACNYKSSDRKLKSPVTLFKATEELPLKIDTDYGLSKYFENNIDICNVDGNHVTILENDCLADQINVLLGVEI